MFSTILDLMTTKPSKELKENLYNAFSGDIYSDSDVCLYAAANEPALFNTLITETLKELGITSRESILKAVDKAGYTVLHWAARHGNIEAVNNLLDNGAAPYARTREQNTPLDIAVKYNQRAVVERLLKITKDPEDLNKALNIAITSQPELIEPILTHLAKRPTKEQAASLKDLPGGPYPNVFFYAAANHPILFTKLINQTLNELDHELRQTIIESSDENGNTVLHFAAKHGDADAVTYLLANGAKSNALTKEQNTPLHIAVMNKNDAVAEVLFKSSQLDAKNKKHETALDIAIASYSQKLTDSILLHLATRPIAEQEKCLSNRPTAGSEYPNVNVVVYALGAHPHLFFKLLDQMAPEQRKSVIQGKNLSLLDYAAYYGNTEAMKYLLDYATKQEVNYPDSYTLFRAVLSNKLDAVTLLLNRLPNLAANLKARTYYTGTSAFDEAKAKIGHMDTAILLHIATLPVKEQAQGLQGLPGGPYASVYIYAATNHIDLLEKLVGAKQEFKTIMAPIYDSLHTIALDNQKMKLDLDTWDFEGIVENYKKAISTTETLLQTCIEKMAIFYKDCKESETPNTKLATFQTDYHTAIRAAEPVLSKYPNWIEVLRGFMLIVLSLPVSLPLITTGLFSIKPTAQQNLDRLAEDVNQIDLKSGPRKD